MIHPGPGVDLSRFDAAPLTDSIYCTKGAASNRDRSNDIIVFPR